MAMVLVALELIFSIDQFQFSTPGRYDQFSFGFAQNNWVFADQPVLPIRSSRKK